jgi:RsiW-degrading membrane proteinase PrsW (M82 family)
MATIGHMEGLLSIALWLAGIGHFCVLFASTQVPRQLHWKTDLAKLEPFNRKLMWTYGGFTVYTIIAFGVMTLVLHNEMLRGERAALVLALFIGVYWLLRIVVDFTYYSHEDWPKGRQFVIGHTLLTLLFAFLSASNLTVVIWNVWNGRGR